MWYVEIRPCDVLAFYHETIFKKCYSINHRDELDQLNEQLTVVGIHCDLGLVTMHQSGKATLLVSEHCHVPDGTTHSSDDETLEARELLLDAARRFALTKAKVSGVLDVSIETSVLQST